MGRFSNFGIRVHPGSYSGKGKRRIGITPIIRCMQCGFPNDTRSCGWSNQGEGNAPSGDSSEMLQGSGCGFCGSMFWYPSPPPALEDDRLLSDRHIKRKR